MKYALVNDTKTEATKGVKGVCPICDSELIAKCGEHKINHWAHKGTWNCDPWWEPETEWHRNWKDNYPSEWQEISLPDEQTGEKHIADVRTIHNLVIEFQHSHIDPKERNSREKFYKNMVWVVDGTRLQRDYPRFRKGMGNFRQINQQCVFSVDFPDEVLPKNWLNSSAPVIFDFCGLSTAEQDEITNTLWCLLPQKDVTWAIVIGLRRKDFVQTTYNRGQLFPQNEKPQQRQITPPQQLKVQKRHKEGTHYYDPKRGRFVKKRRL